MPHRNIAAGQQIDAEKLDFARELRKQMTPAETRLWSSLRGRKLNGLKFRRQQIIDGFIADFFCSSAGLAIELDGSVHESQADYDANRDSVVSERGLRIIRISNDRIVFELEAMLVEISVIAGHTPSHSADLTPQPPLRNGEGEPEKIGP